MLQQKRNPRVIVGPIRQRNLCLFFLQPGLARNVAKYVNSLSVCTIRISALLRSGLSRRLKRDRQHGQVLPDDDSQAGRHDRAERIRRTRVKGNWRRQNHKNRYVARLLQSNARARVVVGAEAAERRVFIRLEWTTREKETAQSSQCNLNNMCHI